jgi:hypothetical protein
LNFSCINRNRLALQEQAMNVINIHFKIDLKKKP